MTLTYASLAAAFTLAAVGTPNAAAADRYRLCGSALVQFRDGEGSATKIHATSVSCRRARIVAKACMRGTLTGWRPAGLPSDNGGADRIELRRGRAIVTFAIAGGGRDCSA
jgi:hypothetical protein